MNKLVTFVCASGLTLAAGAVGAQDNQPALELASKVVPVDMYICSFHDGQGPEQLDEAVEGWNGYMDRNGTDDYAAWILTKFYSGNLQDFDFIWLGAWKDGHAMGAGTDMWLTTGGEYIEKFGEIADCGRHINLASINYKLPRSGTPDNSVIAFTNCDVMEGQSYGAVAEAAVSWSQVLTDAGSTAAIYHWFPVYGGGGERADFQLVTAHENYTELGADLERMTNGELFRQSNALFADLMECDIDRVYNATSIRRAEIR